MQKYTCKKNSTFSTLHICNQTATVNDVSKGLLYCTSADISFCILFYSWMTKKSKYCWSDENNPPSGLVSLAETVIPSLTHQILDRINSAGLCEAAELLTGVVTVILSYQFI